MKRMASECPEDDDEDRDDKRPGAAQNTGSVARENAEGIANATEKVSPIVVRRGAVIGFG